MAGPYTTFTYGDPAAVNDYSSNPHFNGQHFVFGLFVSGGGGGVSGVPIIWGEQLENGTVGIAYSETLNAAGGTSPYSFSLASGSLPPGLSLSSSGVISGTPTSAGTYTFSVTVTDSASPANSNTQTFQIIVSAPASGGNYGWVS